MHFFHLMVTRRVLVPAQTKMKTDFNQLTPELKDWNNGNGNSTI